VVEAALEHLVVVEEVVVWLLLTAIHVPQL
jgi:hypothetical protein